MEGMIPYIEEGICLLIALSLFIAAVSPALLGLADGGQKTLATLMRRYAAWRKK